MNNDVSPGGQNKSVKVPLSVKLCYGLGDIYGGGSFNIINFFYAFFLANIVRIPTYWAAVIMMVARLWDAFSDPIMGLITDNTRSKFGRRKPYFIAGIPLIVISMIWVWYPASFQDMTLKILFTGAGYLFYNTVVTMVIVPYTAYAPEITMDYYERNSLNTIRVVFSLLSSLMCALVPLEIVSVVLNKTGSYANSYFVMALVIGLIFALPYIGVILGTKERKDFMSAPKIKGSWKPMLQSLKVRSFRKLVLLYLCIFVSLDLITTSFQFYMSYVLKRPEEFSFVLGLLIIVEIAAAFLTAPLAKKDGKQYAALFGCAIWILTGLCTLLLTPDSPGFLIYVIAMMMGFGMAFPIVLLTSLFADVTDIGELYFGTRVEGVFSGVQTFIRKCASAIANASFMAILGLTGFVAPISKITGIREELIYQLQPDSMLTFISLTIAVFPILFLGIGIYILIRWPITSENHAKTIRYLEAKRAGNQPDALLENEVLALRDTVL